MTIDFMHLGPPLYSKQVGKCLKGITKRNCRVYFTLFLYQSTTLRLSSNVELFMYRKSSKLVDPNDISLMFFFSAVELN